MPDDPAKITATLRVRDQLVQALRLRIAKSQKLAFGKSSEKIEPLELAPKDLLVAVAKDDDGPIDEGQDEPADEAPSGPDLRRRPRVPDAPPRECHVLDPSTCCPDCCPDCGGDLRVMGEDVCELLDMIAAQMKVIQIARIKTSCRRCEKDSAGASTQPPDPGRHGRAEPAGACVGVEVRRSFAALSPARDLCTHGG